MKYLTTTFSPAMLMPNSNIYFSGQEIALGMARSLLPMYESRVGHENTAKILSALFESEVEFNRSNIKLEAGDFVLAVIPNFRTNEAREFSRKEVEDAGVRCFLIQVIVM